MTKLLYPKPKRLYYELETFNSVKEHRKIDCIFYSICLNHAAYFFWESFSCKQCKLYYPDIEENQNLKNQQDKCIILINQIKTPEKKFIKHKLKRKVKNNEFTKLRLRKSCKFIKLRYIYNKSSGRS